MKKVILLLFVALVIGLLGVYILVIHRSVDLNKAHGTVDIQDSLLSFERSGKIITLYADEGVEVHQGDLLARLDSQALEHQQRIQFAQCEAERALLDQYQNGYLKEELDAAKASVAKAQAAVDLAALTYQRNASLLKTKSVSKQDYDSAKAAYDQAQAALAESKAQLALYQRGYREEVIAAQAAKVTACSQQLRYLDYQINNQGMIRAPFSGTIRSRTHELSDFVGAGETIYALTNERIKKIRIYLSENQLNLIKIGQDVSVEVPFNAPLTGKITFISPSAMFTPKSVQTEDLRADLVYEVTVEVADPNKVLRFGQAITVYLKGSAPDNQDKSAQNTLQTPNNQQQVAAKQPAQTTNDPQNITTDHLPIAHPTATATSTQTVEPAQIRLASPDSEPDSHDSYTQDAVSSTKLPSLTLEPTTALKVSASHPSAASKVATAAKSSLATWPEATTIA